MSSDQQAIQPSELYEWVRKQTRLRAVGIVEALEEISIAQSWTANQVAFWQALALSGSRQPIVGYGRIFGLRLPLS